MRAVLRAGSSSALVTACLVACARRSEPPVPMGIHVPNKCYHARQDDTRVHFAVTGVTTPRMTDGDLKFVITDRQDNFPPLTVSQRVVLNTKPPKDVAFTVDIPESANASALFELRLVARSGPDDFTALLTSPCD